MSDKLIYILKIVVRLPFDFEIQCSNTTVVRNTRTCQYDINDQWQYIVYNTVQHLHENK